MKVEYAIPFDDFRALQKPISLQVDVRFKGGVVVCGVMASLGIYCIIANFGLSVGGFLVGLAAVGGLAVYLHYVRSVRRAKEKYERDIALAYERLHCRDHRVVETNETGFTMTCNCGAVTYEWSQLVQFAENDRFFQLRTKADGLVLPKSAFASEGDKTEFRRLAAEQIYRTLAFASRSIELVSTKHDYWSARLLHVLRGGGWRRLAGASLFLVGAASIFAIFHEHPPQNAIEKFTRIEIAIMSAVVAFSALMFVRGRKLKGTYRTALRMSFGEAGLHFQDAVAIARNPWESFCGYLEGRSIFLLYYNARLYRIIPKRALGSRETEFRELLLRKVSPFDYRNPFRLGPREVSGLT